MSSSARTTTDHRYIKSWTDSRNGVPARIKETANGHQDGILRIHFPDVSDDDEQFERLSWQEFFDIFDDANLAFVYQEDMSSTFHKFVNRA